MTSIIVAPEVQKARIDIQGIFTVNREDAALACACPERRGDGCGGIEIASIPLAFRAFELLCSESAKKFLASMKARGREWTGEPLVLHGPWPSRMVALSDADSPTWNEAMKRDKTDGFEHPERALGFVQNLMAPYTHMDYVLVTRFWIKDEYTDLEV